MQLKKIPWNPLGLRYRPRAFSPIEKSSTVFRYFYVSTMVLSCSWWSAIAVQCTSQLLYLFVMATENTKLDTSPDTHLFSSIKTFTPTFNSFSRDMIEDSIIWGFPRIWAVDLWRRENIVDVAYGLVEFNRKRHYWAVEESKFMLHFNISSFIWPNWNFIPICQ